MTPYQIRMLQARCAALGFWPGPIDGKMGPRTREAEADARAFQRQRGKPFIHDSGISQIRWHWTGGQHKANTTDRAAYHTLLEGDGKLIRLVPYTAARSHTLNANTGAASLAMCCMAGARERPFLWGTAPMTSAQLYALVVETAALSRQYDIPVSPFSMMSHSEVQPTLGIAQNQKWDINIIPGMEAPGNPIAVGDKIREMVRRELSK